MALNELRMRSSIRACAVHLQIIKYCRTHVAQQTTAILCNFIVWPRMFPVFHRASLIGISIFCALCLFTVLFRNKIVISINQNLYVWSKNYFYTGLCLGPQKVPRNTCTQWRSRSLPGHLLILSKDFITIMKWNWSEQETYWLDYAYTWTVMNISCVFMYFIFYWTLAIWSRHNRCNKSSLSLLTTSNGQTIH